MKTYEGRGWPAFCKTAAVAEKISPDAALGFSAGAVLHTKRQYIPGYEKRR